MTTNTENQINFGFWKKKILCKHVTMLLETQKLDVLWLASQVFKHEYLHNLLYLYMFIPFITIFFFSNRYWVTVTQFWTLSRYSCLYLEVGSCIHEFWISRSIIMYLLTICFSKTETDLVFCFGRHFHRVDVGWGGVGESGYFSPFGAQLLCKYLR